MIGGSVTPPKIIVMITKIWVTALFRTAIMHIFLNDYLTDDVKSEQSIITRVKTSSFDEALRFDLD